MDRMLKTTEVAKILGVSDQKVREMCMARELPAWRTGKSKGHFRVRESAVIEFIRDAELPSTSSEFLSQNEVALPYAGVSIGIREKIRRMK